MPAEGDAVPAQRRTARRQVAKGHIQREHLFLEITEAAVERHAPHVAQPDGVPTVRA